MSGLTERLRVSFDEWTPDATYDARREAADLIEALERQLSDLRAQGEFLVARIQHLEWSSGFGVFQREWQGHVEPALARFCSALNPHEGEKGDA